MHWTTKQRIKRGFWAALVLVFLSWGIIDLVPWEDIWDGLREVENQKESASTTIRNIGLILFAFIAVPLAYWRSRVAHLSLLNERYQKSSEMLGSAILATRLGGIYALDALAKEYPKKYQVQAIQLFCAFVRYPTIDERARQEKTIAIKAVGKENYTPQVRLREDVQAIMNIISSRSERRIVHEKRADFFWIDLQGSELKCVNLAGKKLHNAILYSTDLSFAVLAGTDLTEIRLSDANLTGTQFSDISGDGFFGAAVGLTQDQLDLARANPEHPPILDGVTDAQTGKQLVWRGKPLHDA